MAKCNVCFRQCEIEEGSTGFCGVRTCQDGMVVPSNYGRVTSLALDPIEKKPLNRFHPGSMILSVGSYGCDLRCPFCQNHEIAAPENNPLWEKRTDRVSPEQLAETAARFRDRGNIGIAYTYNEPLVGFEFVRDTAKLACEAGMKNVLVTNGMASLDVLEEIAPYIDAMNIDLKGFTDRFYEDVLGGNRKMVMDFIAAAAKRCHVEITTLIIPGENDTEEEMAELSRWIAGLETAGGGSGTEIPLHVSRFFPRHRMTDRDATEVELVYRLAEVARTHLKYVYTGNC